MSKDTFKDFSIFLNNPLFANNKVSIKEEQLFQLNSVALPWQENETNRRKKTDLVFVKGKHHPPGVGLLTMAGDELFQC